MVKNLHNIIVQIIQSFKNSLQAHLPALEKEVTALIETKCKDCRVIENYLDTLLSLTDHGVADELFIKLLDYYKTIDADGAAFYWNEYDKDDE